MNKEIANLLEYFSLLQIMATTGKTHAAIIQCLGLLAEGVEFKEGYQSQFLESLQMAMADSQEALHQIEKAEARINKRHHDALLDISKTSQNH